LIFLKSFLFHFFLVALFFLFDFHYFYLTFLFNFNLFFLAFFLNFFWRAFRFRFTLWFR